MSLNTDELISKMSECINLMKIHYEEIKNSQPENIIARIEKLEEDYNKMKELYDAKNKVLEDKMDNMDKFVEYMMSFRKEVIDSFNKL